MFSEHPETTIFTINHLADTSIQSDLQMTRTIEALKPKESNGIQEQ